MKLSERMRMLVGQYRFIKELKKAKPAREVIGFDAATRIGMLYDATEEKDFETVKNYVKQVRANHKKEILALGFVDQKELQRNQFAQLGLDFFTRKDLDFGMIPKNPIVENFINEKFDILINLNPGKCFPLQYISAMSHARFRVGCYNKSDMMCYDMMVKLKGEPAIKTIIEEIEHFLRIIRNHERK